MEIIAFGVFFVIASIVAVRTFTQTTGDNLGQVGDCVASGGCAGAGGGAAGAGGGAAGAGGAGDGATGFGGGGSAGGGATGSTAQAVEAEPPGFWSRVGSGIATGGSAVWSFGKGVVVDGVGGAIVGTFELGYNVVTDPIGTGEAVVGGVSHAVMNPGETWDNVSQAFSEAWEEDPARALGRGVFEIASLVVPVTKGSAVSKVARAADAVVPDAIADAGRTRDAIRGAEHLASVECRGGVCTPGSGQCFAAGTPVLTASGEKAIERISAGDVVLARDEETGETRFERVARTFVRESPVVELTLRAGFVEEHLVTTLEHPFHMNGAGFVTVGELAIGDHVDTATGTARVVALASLPERITVYNFEVENAHTYFVGHTGAWVHNSCDLARAHGREPPPAKLSEPLVDIVRRDPLAAGDALWGSRDKYGNPSLRELPATTPEALAIRDAIDRGEVQIRLFDPDAPDADKFHGGFRPPERPGDPPTIEIAYEGQSGASRGTMAESVYHEAQHYRQWVEAGRPDPDTFYAIYEKNWYWMETEAEVVGRARTYTPGDDSITAIKRGHTDSYSEHFGAPPPGYMASGEIRPAGVSLRPPQD